MGKRRPGGETPSVGSEMIGMNPPRLPVVEDEIPTDFLREETSPGRGDMDTAMGLPVVEAREIKVPSVEFRFDVRTYNETLGRVNQDAVLVDHEHGLFAVCDGLGGYGGGDKASAMAVQLFKEVYAEIQNEPGEERDMRQKIRLTVAEVNTRLDQWRRETKKPVKGRKNMVSSELMYPNAATTFAGIFLEQAEDGQVVVYTANIGDSRVYRHSVAENKTECVSLDDGAAFSLLAKHPEEVVDWMIGGYIDGVQDMPEPLLKGKDKQVVSRALRNFTYTLYMAERAMSDDQKQKAWQNYFSRLRDVPTIESLRESVRASSLDEVIEGVVQWYIDRRSNVIDKCIPSKRLDVGDMSIHIQSFAAQPGDMFLLVTDGITDCVPDYDIHVALSSNDLDTSISLLHQAVVQQRVQKSEFMEKKNSGNDVPKVCPRFKRDDANSVLIRIPK